MENRIKQIIEGWRNYLIPPDELKDKIEEVYNYRMEICRQCDEFSENVRKKKQLPLTVEYCTNCGCALSAKARCLSCSCPLGKW